MGSIEVGRYSDQIDSGLGRQGHREFHVEGRITAAVLVLVFVLFISVREALALGRPAQRRCDAEQGSAYQTANNGESNDASGDYEDNHQGCQRELCPLEPKGIIAEVDGLVDRCRKWLSDGGDVDTRVEGQIAIASIARHLFRAVVQETDSIDTILVLAAGRDLGFFIVASSCIHAHGRWCQGDVLLFVGQALTDPIDAGES